MDSRCRRIWHYLILSWLASFGYAEMRGYRRHCHPTLSRQSAVWLRCTPEHRHRYVGPGLFTVGCGLFAWHVLKLPELECSHVE